MSTQTPSKRTKYANDEERKAAARERQRLYAARKRAEAKEAKLRESQSSIDLPDASPVAVVTVASEVAPEVSAPAKKLAPRKSAVVEDNVTTTATVTVNAAATPRKRVARRKNHEIGEDVGINGNNAVHVVSKLELEDTTDRPKIRDIGITEDISIPSIVHSFSEPLTIDSFIPPSLHPTDTILIPPQFSPTSQLHSSLPVTSYAILHIPGNPGLISYYTNYLTILSHHLSDIPGCEFTVFGASLGGFNTTSSPNSPRIPFVPLKDQITRQIELITHLLTTHPSLKIIITGHSLGAYLLLSLLHNLSTHNPILKSRIIGGIGLFPALTHLAKSSSGRTVTPFINIPGVLPFLVVVAKVLVTLIPAVILNFLMKIFMPAHEQSARDTTLSFLKSPIGVKEALYLGRDELMSIKDDEWDVGVWGDGNNNNNNGDGGNTELIFYFGEKDHWVFDGEREKLIERRGRGGVRWVEKNGDEIVEDRWKPRMMICEDGVRHSFCVSAEYSELMAEKTARWVEEIVEKDRSRL